MKNDKPLAVFGIITDVQYADHPDKVSNGTMRYYRSSLKHINRAVNSWKSEDLTSFKLILQLGDLIDGKCQRYSYAALNKVLKEFELMSDCQLLHIWGNHEMYNFSRFRLTKTPLNTARILNQFKNGGNYFTYDASDKIKLICLDYYELVHSTLFNKSDKKKGYGRMYKEVESLLKDKGQDPDKEEINEKRIKFSGGLSSIQIGWLESQLENCKKNNKKAIVCGHVPLMKKTCGDKNYMALNRQKILKLINSYTGVCVAYFAGHFHRGGSFQDCENKILHITFPAVVEADPENNCFSTVKIYEEKVIIELYTDENKNFEINLL